MVKFANQDIMYEPYCKKTCHQDLGLGKFKTFLAPRL